MEISEYMRNKSVRYGLTYVITNEGKGYYLVDGKRRTEQEMEVLFPVNVINIRPKSLKGENSDRTKMWMQS